MTRMARISLVTLLETVRAAVKGETTWCIRVFSHVVSPKLYIHLPLSDVHIHTVVRPNQPEALSALSRSYRKTLCMSTSAPMAQSSGLVYSSGL